MGLTGSGELETQGRLQHLFGTSAFSLVAMRARFSQRVRVRESAIQEAVQHLPFGRGQLRARVLLEMFRQLFRDHPA